MEEESSLKILNEQTIEVQNEDHTMMNPLKWAVSKNFLGRKVEFCGYTIPHPSDNLSHFTVQLENEEAQTPHNVLKKMSEGLKCLSVIGNKLLNDLETL